MKRKDARNTILSFLSFIVIGGAINGAYAADLVDEQNGILKPRQTDNMLAEDSPDFVTPQDGNLWIKQQDAFIPGNGGMDIAIWRTYSMNRTSSGLTATHNGSYRWAALGPGWSIDAAPKITVNNEWGIAGNGDWFQTNYRRNLLVDLCLTTNSHKQSREKATRLLSYNIGPDPLLELPDGTTERIFSIGNHEARTKNNWRISCVNNVVQVYSPEGTVYNYGGISERRIGQFYINGTEGSSVQGAGFGTVPLTESYMLAKSAIDAHGNKLVFSYKTFGKPVPLWTMPGYVEEPKSLYNGPVYGGFSGDFSKLELPFTVLESVKSDDGRQVLLTYDDLTGKLKSLRTSSGATVNYSYQAKDNLNAMALSKVDFGGGQAWSFTYYPGVYVTAMVEFIPLDQVSISARKLKSITYPTGGVASYEYGHAIHRVDFKVKHKYRNLKVAHEFVRRRTLSSGSSWTYAFTKGSDGVYDTTIINGPEGKTTLKYFGASFKRALSPFAPGSEESIWQIGNIAEKVDPLGNVETLTWQPRLITPGNDFVVDLGYVLDTKINASILTGKTVVRGGAKFISTYSNHDVYGNPRVVTETGPNGESRTTSISYFNDPAKWIIGKPNDEISSGQKVIRTYDSNGNLLTEAVNGIATQYSYDLQGNVASKILPGNRVFTYSNYRRGIPQTEVQPEGITLTRVVDDAGNITSENNGEGRTTNYTYDGLGRVTSKTPMAGNVQTITYTSTSKTSKRGSLVETTQYDPFGRVASVTLGGITTRYEHDALGRRTFVSDPDSTTGTRYQYDALGRVTRVTNADTSYQAIAYGAATRTVTDERRKATIETYRGYGNPDQLHLMAITGPEPSADVTLTRDAADRITSVKQGTFTRTYTYYGNGYLSSVTNPETGKTVFGRDVAGNMTTKQVGVSGVTRYTYDGQNRLKSVTYPGTTSAVTNAYDKTNRLLTSTSTGGNRAMAYDAVGNLIQQSLTLDGKTFTAKYAYNGNDQLVSITYPQSGRVVNYTPDVLGRPTTVSGYVNKVTYWPSGMINQITYANGTTTSYTQNSRLWPATFSTVKTGGATYLNSAYTYDGTGNLATIRDSVDSSFNRTLGYDGINRLTSAAGFWGTGTISYDGVGNLLKQTYGNTSLSYAYDTQNRLASVSGQRAGSFTYDAYGNIASSAGTTYTYDGVPNLVCINCAVAANKVTYQYDAINQRSSVTKDGRKLYEMYGSDGKQLIELDGTTLTEYIYLGDKRIADRVSP